MRWWWMRPGLLLPLALAGARAQEGALVQRLPPVRSLFQAMRATQRLGRAPRVLPWSRPVPTAVPAATPEAPGGEAPPGAPGAGVPRPPVSALELLQRQRQASRETFRRRMLDSRALLGARRPRWRPAEGQP